MKLCDPRDDPDDPSLMIAEFQEAPGTNPANRALQQLLEQTNWRERIYLIIDMPPSTGGKND